jgi:hypothetical protein
MHSAVLSLSKRFQYFERRPVFYIGLLFFKPLLDETLVVFEQF